MIFVITSVFVTSFTFKVIAPSFSRICSPFLTIFAKSLKLLETSFWFPSTSRHVIVNSSLFSSITGVAFCKSPVRIFGPERSIKIASGTPIFFAAARAFLISSACSTQLPCDIFIRTALSPTLIKFSIISCESVAGPSVASILALVIFDYLSAKLENIKNHIWILLECLYPRGLFRSSFAEHYMSY